MEAEPNQEVEKFMELMQELTGYALRYQDLYSMTRVISKLSSIASTLKK